MALPYDNQFKGAEREFLNAHAHLRSGDYEAALVESGKALESTMRTICDLKEFAYNESKATVSTLVTVLCDRGFIKPYLQQHFTGLRLMLESGGTIRNKEGAHGSGQAPREVPRELVEYALHQTAANIVYMVKTFKGSL